MTAVAMTANSPMKLGPTSSFAGNLADPYEQLGDPNMSMTTISEGAPTARGSSVPPWINPARVPLTDEREYARLEHPGPWCAEATCLTRPSISGDGRIRSWYGPHRIGLQVLSIKAGPVIEIGYGVEEDDGPRIESPYVILRFVDPDAEGPDEDRNQAVVVETTADEADSFAELLKDAARSLRFTQEAVARAEQREAEQDARAERVPCSRCGELFPVPVEQRGKRISAEAFSAACSATGMPAKCPNCRSKADEDALSKMQVLLNYAAGLGGR